MELVLPTDGCVFLLSVRYEKIAFVIGYCKAMMHVDAYMRPIGGFSQHSDAALAKTWAAPCEFGLERVGRYEVDAVPEVQWMKGDL